MVAGLAAAGIAQGALGAWGAQSAAQTEAQGQLQALAMEQQFLQPVMQQGQGITAGALPSVMQAITPGQTEAWLQNNPGYKFAQQQVFNQDMNAGTVMGLGGNTLRAVGTDAAGLAAQYQGQFFNQADSVLNAGIQEQAGAAGSLASAAGSAITGAANAQAQGTLGMTNALGGGLQSAALLSVLGSKSGMGMFSTGT